MSLRNSNISPTGALSFAGLPLALGLSGCWAVDISINNDDGVPLSELDMGGPPPVELVLNASDNVILTRGDTLSIDVEGSDEAVAAVRFVLDDDTLVVTREEELWDGSEAATVRITMPDPSEVTITGSGSVEAQSLAQDAQVSLLSSGSFTGGDAKVSSLDVNIAGSGTARFGEITAEAFEINLAGSGSVFASGRTSQLELNSLASGDADLSGLKTDDAQLSLAGSGSVSLQSDGEVEANILGSGSVTVTGDANCIENTVGSGSLTCSA